PSTAAPGHVVSASRAAAGKLRCSAPRSPVHSGCNGTCGKGLGVSLVMGGGRRRCGAFWGGGAGHRLLQAGADVLLVEENTGSRGVLQRVAGTGQQVGLGAG